MFSNDITLKEFVCSIPICQSEADLGSILHIFHQTSCDSLAISGKNHTWGIISSHDLLSLLAKSWQQLPIAKVGHPRRTPHQRGSSADASREIYSLIKPAIVYQAGTSLQEFLKSLKENYFQISHGKYLIVNPTGELQGKLDQDKLLRYIASRFDERSTKNELPVSSTTLLSLLDNLPLPLKIETIEQKNCYENRCWQKLISHSQDLHSVSSQELNVSIANWWMMKQIEILQHNSDETNQQSARIPIDRTDSTGEFCCLGDLHYSLYKPENLSQAINITNSNSENFDLEKSTVEYSDNFVMSCLLDNSYAKPLDSNTLGIQIEEGIEWNRIKIPLRLESEKISETKKALYWLVLAIKPSILRSDNNQLDKSASLTIKSTVDQLLATISHELKSPLTGIVGLSSLLNSQKLGELNQRQTKYVQLIHHSGHKLMTIVNDLIELTSLTTGKFNIQPETIELKPLFRKLYQQIITRFQTIGSTESDLLISTSGLELNIQSGLEITIADRLRLSSILSHLMLETIQLSSSPSIALKVEVKNLDGYRAITIKNDVTNIIVTSDEEPNSASQDIGLNLIIAKYLAQALQGDIKSKYCSESYSFTLLLPIIELKADDVSSISNQTVLDRHKPQTNLTILCLYPELEVIDTNAGNNNGLDFNLKKWAEQDWSNDNQEQLAYRYRIIEADGLEQAHTLARIWQLDVIVLDGYQIVNAPEYLRSLQKSEYLSALPLITLDTQTTEAANQTEGLNVYPCLLPAQCRSIRDLMQVIQIATE